jgi:hypothetical protein
MGAIVIHNLLRSIAVGFAVVLLQGATLAQEGQLSENERLRWELAAVRSQLHAALAERDACRVQIVPMRGAEISAELTSLKDAVEAAHPGFMFDIKTGKLTPKPKGDTER